MRTLMLASAASALLLAPCTMLAQPDRPVPPPRPPEAPEGPREHRMPPMISVTGRSEVAAKPDLAVLRLGATAQGQTAAAAHQQVSVVMNEVLGQLAALNIPEERISTSGLTIYPVYSEPRPRDQGAHEPRIVGYRASNTVRIELTDLGMVGQAIDVSVGAGANQFEGLTFELRDDSELRRRALRQAVQEAKAKAETIAGALEVQIEGLQEAAEANVGIVYPQMQRMAMGRELAMAADMGTPIQPGQVRVEATVTLSYRVRPNAGN